jgi:hypothetical protein
VPGAYGRYTAREVEPNRKVALTPAWLAKVQIEQAENLTRLAAVSGDSTGILLRSLLGHSINDEFVKGHGQGAVLVRHSTPQLVPEIEPFNEQESDCARRSAAPRAA